MQCCALVIGHKKTSPGAANVSSGLTEFDYNETLSKQIEDELISRQAEIRIQRIYRRTYATLPGDINELAPRFIISLHCNAFNTQASGCEMLYYHRSSNGKRMAQILQTHIQGALGNKDRGIKAKTSEDRGGMLLKQTHAPCVIAEPFFIDNDDELELVQKKRKKLVRAYADAIEAIGKTL